MYINILQFFLVFFSEYDTIQTFFTGHVNSIFCCECSDRRHVGQVDIIWVWGAFFGQNLWEILLVVGHRRWPQTIFTEWLFFSDVRLKAGSSNVILLCSRLKVVQRRGESIKLLLDDCSPVTEENAGYGYSKWREAPEVTPIILAKHHGG